MSSGFLQLLSPALIQQYPRIVLEIDRLCSALWKEIGWHYILDLIWIIRHIEYSDLPKGSTIVDAGAGSGVLQYLLADRGYEVISVDFAPRRFPVLSFLVFSIERMGSKDKVFEHRYIEHLAKSEGLWNKMRRLRVKMVRSRFAPLELISMSVGRVMGRRKPGRIQLYRADMKNMEELKSNSVDAVVSVSAVEHVDPNDIPVAVKEFERVLKPGAAMMITTSAARDKDWFHEPAKGWCFCEASLHELFGIAPETPAVFSAYDKLMDEFQGSQELQRRLSSLYFVSGDNGMPWGRWHPMYLPVGVFKRTRFE